MTITMAHRHFFVAIDACQNGLQVRRAPTQVSDASNGKSEDVTRRSVYPPSALFHADCYPSYKIRRHWCTFRPDR
jgi:hypothetical protein